MQAIQLDYLPFPVPWGLTDPTESLPYNPLQPVSQFPIHLLYRDFLDKPDPTYIQPHGRAWGRGSQMPEFEKYENMSWDVVSSVKASKRRTQVLKALAGKPMLNGEIADELDVSTPWVRRQVKWLEKHDLVQDLTESKQNYKLYGITDEGEKVLEVL